MLEFCFALAAGRLGINAKKGVIGTTRKVGKHFA
jgi:hypothetical protein